LEGLVVFDAFGRPFEPQGSLTTMQTSGVESDVVTHITATISLRKTALSSQDGWNYQLVTGDGGAADSALSVLAIAGDGARADMGVGVAPSYFMSADFSVEPVYSRDLAREFFIGVGDAGASLRQRSLFGSFDLSISPRLGFSTLMITSAAEDERPQAGALVSETALVTSRDELERSEASLFKVGARYDFGAGLAGAASYGLMLEEGAVLGMRGTGAFALTGEATTQVFGLSLRYDFGTASALKLFAERSSTATTTPAASIFSGTDDWRSSKFGFIYEANGIFGDDDAMQLTVARPWLVDEGRLALNVPIGRELDGTVNYADRIVSVGSDAAPIEVGLHYRGRIELMTYGLSFQATDRDLNARDQVELTLGAALLVSF
jgi:hypothetical protein